VRAEISDQIEMRCEPRIGEHAPGIAAHREDLARLDKMVTVELECVRLVGQTAFVDDGLPVIFAGRLEPIELE